MCKAGPAVGSVKGGKSSCRNFTLAVVVTLRFLVREHREKEQHSKTSALPWLKFWIAVGGRCTLGRGASRWEHW